MMDEQDYKEKSYAEKLLASNTGMFHLQCTDNASPASGRVSCKIPYEPIKQQVPGKSVGNSSVKWLCVHVYVLRFNE